MNFIKPIMASAELMTPHQWLEDYPQIVEEAGRTCHATEERVGENTELFLRKVLHQLGHESISEHLVLTVRIRCDRRCSHQLVRHRISAFSQSSQRYINYHKGQSCLEVVAPPYQQKILGNLMGKPMVLDSFLLRPMENVVVIGPEMLTFDNYVIGDSRTVMWANAMARAFNYYCDLIDLGESVEEAAGALPGNAATTVVTTFNLRQWRHVLKTRLHPKAQHQIRKVMGEILRVFRGYEPLHVFFEGINEI